MNKSKRSKFAEAPADFDSLLAAHKRWVESDGREGSSLSLRGMSFVGADLTGAMLKGADFSDSRFRNAVLTGANLEGANLAGTDFQGAELSHADFRGANVRDSCFHDASLLGADLTGTIGLLSGQLSGAVLASAKLPDNVGGFEGLTNVTEASKTTQNLFASILLVCSYTWLTIASTTDPQLLNNAAPPASRLPILGTDIPLVRFYLVAPLLLLCLFIYFHLCLQRLWEELAELPAVFPDGRPLDKRAYPWLMNVVVRAHLPRLRANRSNLSRWQARMSMLLAWGLVPLTIVILWGRYLRGHEVLGTSLHVILIAATVAAGAGFLHLAASTLRGSEKRPFLWAKAWGDARTRSLVAGLVALVFFATLSYGAIEGVDSEASERATAHGGSVGRFSPRRFVPPVLAYLGISTFAQLDDASLSTKPPSWSGGTQADLGTVKGADISNRNLRHASAFNAFLVNAYLMKVEAQGADFREADLRKADFRDAKLAGTNFRYANLREADLRYADLTGAKLTEAKLEGANLRDAIMTEVQIREAKLAGANFTRANLQKADFTGSDLSGADFSGANLIGVIGLTQEQIDVAIVDKETKLPSGLRPGPRLAKIP